MGTALTIGIILVLAAGGVHVIQRLNAQRAERIALFRYHAPLSGHEGPGQDTGRPLPKPTVQLALRPRRDNRDGGRGRLRPRRRNVRARASRT